MSPQRRLRRWEASEYLRTTWGLSYKANTLAKLATIGGGPPFELFGRWPVYRETELDRWVQDRLSDLRSSTSDKRLVGSTAARASGQRHCVPSPNTMQRKGDDEGPRAA